MQKKCRYGNSINRNFIMIFIITAIIIVIIIVIIIIIISIIIIIIIIIVAIIVTLLRSPFYGKRPISRDPVAGEIIRSGS